MSKPRTAEYYFRNRIRPPKSFFDSIKNRYDVVVFKSKGDLIKTSKRTSRVEKVVQLRKNTNFDNLREFYFYRALFQDGEKFELQEYCIEKTIDSRTLQEKFEINLANLTVMENNEVNKICSRYSRFFGRTEYMFGVATTFYGFKNYRVDIDCNFHHVDRNNRFIQVLEKIYEDGFDINNFIEVYYKYRKNLHLTMINGMERMFEDIVREVVDWRKMTPKRIKKYWKTIKANNYGYKDFEWMLYTAKTGIKINEKAKEYISISLLDKLPENISKVKIQNYLVKQKQNLGYYIDYLDLMSDIGTQVETDQTKYPKNLRLAHDRAVDVLNLMKKKQKNKKIKKVTEALKKLEYEGNKYCVVCPKKLKDIQIEGKKLDHCVGGSTYLEGHAEGEFFIMFIRDNEDKNKPLYTFTLKPNMTIPQFHGRRNLDKKLDDYQEVKEFLYNEYLPKIKKKYKKVSI